MYNNYIIKVIFFLSLFSAPIAANFLFLLNCGELLPVKEIAEKQLKAKSGSLVGLATRNQGYYYKKELYLKTKPQVLVHGSSRVMQFKEAYFSKRMFNTGGSMNNITEGQAFLQSVFNEHKPSIVILGIDYWWFNKTLREPPKEVNPPVELSHRISFRTYLLPFKWLWQGKITLADYVQHLNPLAYFKGDYAQGIGVDAILNQNGFDHDGSYLYSKTTTGKEKALDQHFAHNLELIKINDPRFDKFAHIDERHFAQFLNLLAFLEAQDIKVVLFIPPVAPTILSHLENGAYVNELRLKLKEAHINFYDFHDPAVLKTSDCEFLDGTHGGEVLYARIIKHLAKHEPDLAPYVDNQYVHRVTDMFGNLARVPKPELGLEPEIDFLQMGCDKSNQLASS